MFSFKLGDAFVATYAERPVPWGFTDAGGNSVGEITFLRTYSRLKEDGTKERWHEVCRRVIEGMFSIQKDYCKASRLPWNDHKAARAAQDAFERMFTFRWTPPGRGLWMMGTPLVMQHRNSAALQNPLRGSTRVVTREGVRQLVDMVGETVEVWAGGDWHKGLVNDMGVQPVQAITFKPSGGRSSVRKIEVATPDHGWVLADGSKTHALKVGDRVAAGAAEDRDEHYVEGFRAGLIFGDGSVSYRYKNGDVSHILRLCGAKAQYAELFETVHYQPNCNGDPVAYHRADRNLKELPPVDAPAGYVCGFLDGWKAADGHFDEASRVWAISTQDADAAQWLLDHAPLGGLVVRGHSVTNRPTNFGPRSASLHTIRVAQPYDKSWTVIDIEAFTDPERVYCFVVPSAGEFTLASGIVSSNCAFVSTGDMTKVDPAAPFAFLMEASMLGVGVGFDSRGAEKDFVIQEPSEAKAWTYRVPDTREGWVQALVHKLESYLLPGKGYVSIDVGDVRPAGSPIKTFGGTAAGPAPLLRLMRKLDEVLGGRDGELLSTVDIADIGNLIGVCVVSGNVRRSAELFQGELDDKEFVNLKNAAVYPERNVYDPDPDKNGWGWMSNNSVVAEVGSNYDHIVDAIAHNGEPGVIWLDMSRRYGRLIDPPNDRDWRVAGFNPCAEQSLESYECCTLVETYIGRHESLEDFKKTLKVAYLYAKTVTLMSTHWPKTNAIMARNRRIGTSIAGIADFADNQGMTVLRQWMNEGYLAVQHYDNLYSEWLGIRPSIKTTTVKPGGTVPLLAGESPGAHWGPGGEYFDRAIRFSKDDPMVVLFRQAQYRVETDLSNTDTTVVVYFPIHSRAKRSVADVTLFEKANLAVVAQRYWSDNSVSVTLTFDPETEGKHVGTVLHMHEGQLKTVSFLPSPKGGVYKQMPYAEISADDYEQAGYELFKVDLSPIYAGEALDAAGEAYCTTDACEVKSLLPA